MTANTWGKTMRKDVALKLRELANEVEGADQKNASQTYSKPTLRRLGHVDDQLASLARREYAYRRNREKYISVHLLGEPVWDMLLELFADRIEGKQSTVSDICNSANVPFTTAMRYLKTLEQHDMVQRVPSIDDNRVVNLLLQDQPFMAMAKFLLEERPLYLGNTESTANEISMIAK